MIHSRARTRRSFLATLLAMGTAGLARPPAAIALGRLPSGGKVSMVIPWRLTSIDPHELDDVPAALFGAAIVDTLFAADDGGIPFPTLALELPSKERKGSRVRLRPGLVTAHGARLDARDVVASIARAKRRGAVTLLASMQSARVDKDDALSLLVDGMSPEPLARSLSSPLVAIVPESYSPLSPDGTGAFRATLQRDHLRLERNPNSARGASLLDQIDVRSAASLREALRSFEVGESDLGWLGRGLYRERKDSRMLDAGALGWVVLRTGQQAGGWGAPGVAQQLADALDHERLFHLGVATGKPLGASTPWGGAKAGIVVDAAAPQLVQIAESVAEQLGRPGHELAASPVSHEELTRQRRTNQFSLMIDIVRSTGSAAVSPRYALLGASSPQIASSPPTIASGDSRLDTRTLSLGVIGELRILGATATAIEGLETWNLADAWRRR